MDNIVFTLNIVAPVFLTILLGWFLRRGGLIDSSFVSKSSTLVFYVALPAMIAVELADTDFRSAMDLGALTAIVGCTLVFFVLAWILSSTLTSDPRSRGAFIQGSVRGNVAIVGLPILQRMMGDSAVTTGVLLLAVIMPLYNILSVLALTLPLNQGAGSAQWRKMGRDVAMNPLVIGVAAGLLLSLSPVKLPGFIMRTADYLGQMTFPLALLGIGGSVSLTRVRARLALTLWTSSIKLLFLPLACTAVGYLFGLSPAMLAILFVVSGVPTAVASFIMVKAMDGDADLAGAIVAVTTFCSALTISAAILVFRATGII